MAAGIRSRTFCFLAGIAICVVAPCIAQAGPALYTSEIRLRLWERNVPYGALHSHPVMGNSPGDLASLSGQAPAGFTLPAGQITLMASLVETLPASSTLIFRSTNFAGANAGGNFFDGGAADVTKFKPVPSIQAEQFGVTFSGGPGRFGGVMNLLGTYNWYGEFMTVPPYIIPIPLTAIGGPVGGTATAMAYLGGTANPVTFVTATVWGFPWDTGTVGARAADLGTWSQSTTSDMGADLRTPSGLGALNLVTPFLVRVNISNCGGCSIDTWYYAGIADLQIQFVPEPSTNTALAVGAGTLAVLSHRSKRRKR